MEEKWAVMVEGKSLPQKFQASYEEALAEASRLAKQERRTVYILQPIAVVELNDVKVTLLV